jgi:nitroreductase/formate hydrogenlyase subunit 6/NADH:ubiquinone oxidoreductase subunit I
MVIPTSRTKEKGRISIDYKICNSCELCVNVCKDRTLTMVNGKVAIDEDPIFGCIACGQCVAICPKDCISLEGRTVTMEDFQPFPSKENKANFDQLYELMFSRRSIRDFKEKEIEPEILDKILKAASTAPMGIPPSDVQLLVLNGRVKVREFANDYIAFLKKMKWMFSPFMLGLMRPFLKKSDYEMFKSFLNPLLDIFIETNKQGTDALFYDAPLAIYFYGTSFSDPADPEIVATYAMLAAETLGVGTTMIGSVGPFIKNGGNSLKKKYNIAPRYPGLFVIFGYPKYKFKKGIKRTFGNISYY